MLDVTSPAMVDVGVQVIRERTQHTGLKALVNNAGINHISPFELTREEDARQLFEVNFFGLCRLTQALIPDLRRHVEASKGSAKIINVGSFGSTMGIPWEPYYHASKFALLGLSESLMFELKRQNIKVTAILPGGIRTDFFDKTGREIDHVLASLGAEEAKHYGEGLTALKRPFQQFKTMATDPMRVAEVIGRTIDARNPPFRKLVGIDANLMYFMVRFFPTRFRQNLLGGMFGA
jgi:short-subunit dehydrogenase